MTAWIHSHPGLKVFLSNPDLSVHEALSDKTHKSRMVALVIDTKTEHFDMGIFTYKSNGALNNTESEMKLFKLEELHNWALKPKDPVFDGYYKINVKEICPLSAL